MKLQDRYVDEMRWNSTEFFGESPDMEYWLGLNLIIVITYPKMGRRVPNRYVRKWRRK